MKANQLTVEQLIQARAFVKSGVSIGIVNIDGRDYSVKTVTEYVSGYFSQLVNGEILVDSNTKKPGVRSINGNLLPAGTTQLVEAIRFLGLKPASGATAADDAGLIGAEWTDSLPPCFKNGEFRMNQNAELLRLSGTDSTNFKSSTSNDDDFKAVAPIVLRGGSAPISAQLRTVGTVVANHGFKFEYRALEFTPVQNA